MGNRYGGSGYILLPAGLVLQLCQVDADYAQGELNFQSLPHSDREFIRDYLDFINSKNSPFFLPLAAVCIVIGFIGNMCFCFFFGDKSSRVFSTKDALFIRWMSVTDFLICLVVLPYAILFETKLIQNNTLCKLMEYIRHVLTYICHILLTTYSVEFTQNDNYFTMKRRLKRSIHIILIVSIIIATPVLYVFEVGHQVDFHNLLEQNASMVQEIILTPIAVPEFIGLLGSDKKPNRYTFFKPQFCHLSLNYDTTVTNFQTMKILQTVYTLTNGLLFLFCAIFVVAQMIKFLDSKPLLGESSIFVQVIEMNNPELAEKLRRIKQAEKERRKSKRLKRLSIRVLHPSVESSSGVENRQEFMMNQIILNSSDKDIYASSKTDIPTPHLFSTSVDYRINSVIIPEPTPPPEESIQSEPIFPPVSLVAFCCFCEFLRSNPRSVRQLASADQLRVIRSYKVSLMVLIIIDLLMLCAAAVGYVISNEKSAVLNIVHFKSVFAFYIISLLQKDLYKSMWGGLSCSRCCGKRESQSTSSRGNSTFKMNEQK